MDRDYGPTRPSRVQNHRQLEGNAKAKISFINPLH